MLHQALSGTVVAHEDESIILEVGNGYVLVDLRENTVGRDNAVVGAEVIVTFYVEVYDSAIRRHLGLDFHEEHVDLPNLLPVAMSVATIVPA